MWTALTFIIIFIAFFLIFRKKIVELLDRVKSISKDGVALGSKQQEAKTEADPQKEAEELMRQFDSALIRETEDIIKEELNKKSLLGVEGIPVLTRYVAALSIAHSFSETYRTIYGSQLNLLDYLNTQTSQPAAALRSFYNSAVSQYPIYYTGYTFEQWLGFLRDRLLIREDASLLGITVRGREFLTHLTTTGLSRYKAG